MSIDMPSWPAAQPDGAFEFDRDMFLRRMLRELSGTLEEIVGLEQAEGFVGVVGQRIADWLDPVYRQTYGVSALDAEQLAATLVDLKRRIGGDFSIEECRPDRIVLVNRACPFGDMVRGRMSLCRMTVSVFGTLAAENQGYSRITIDKAIARGDGGCRVIIDLGGEGKEDGGTEFFRSVTA
jgi:predicted ArsR family transcriptional regulator